MEEGKESIDISAWQEGRSLYDFLSVACLERGSAYRRSSTSYQFYVVH